MLLNLLTNLWASHVSLFARLGAMLPKPSFISLSELRLMRWLLALRKLCGGVGPEMLSDFAVELCGTRMLIYKSQFSRRWAATQEWHFAIITSGPQDDAVKTAMVDAIRLLNDCKSAWANLKPHEFLEKMTGCKIAPWRGGYDYKD